MAARKCPFCGAKPLVENLQIPGKLSGEDIVVHKARVACVNASCKVQPSIVVNGEGQEASALKIWNNRH